RQELSTRMAGEIVISTSPARTIKKWRSVFGVSQCGLASRLGVSPSVISDYESGRRKSPGSEFVKRVVDALIDADVSSGSQVIRGYERLLDGGMRPGAVLDMGEFAFPLTGEEVCRIVKGVPIANGDLLKKDIYGYTALDSLKAILEMSSDEFLRIYGLTSERALVFTKVSGGRSPFVAIRVSPIKPGLVILHGLKKVDPLGIKIAEREKIPVVLAGIESADALIEVLRNNTVV
ncbi:MAG: helix-turn-helix domain-containing protein, partial [Candidatus Hydrothermarchaeaceae archaeon]